MPELPTHPFPPYGFDPDSGLWIFGDCAFTQTGARLLPTEEGGYVLPDRIILPPEAITINTHGVPMLDELSSRDASLAVLSSLAVDLFDCFGGHEGWMALGITMAYAAAPELLGMGGHPGLFIHGRMASGKTTIARWLMRIWGFDTFGISAETSSRAGLENVLIQYSCLPVWLDEYRRYLHPTIDQVLRGAFDRTKTSYGIGQGTRTRSTRPLTSLIITGETPSTDAATRSCYVHVELDASRSIGFAPARYNRVQKSSAEHSRIGCFLMQHRTRFATVLTEELARWESEQTRVTNDHIRFVYGTAYASIVAALAIHETSLPLESYRKCVLSHAIQ